MEPVRNYPEWSKLLGEPVSLAELERIDELAGRTANVEGANVESGSGGIFTDPEPRQPRGFWARLTVNPGGAIYSWQQQYWDGSAYVDLDDGLAGEYDGTLAGLAREVNGNAGLTAHATTGAIVWLELSDGGEEWEFDAGAISAGGTFTGAISQTINDSATDTVTAFQTLTHNSTGTPGTGFGSAIVFQLESTTTTARSAGRLRWDWLVATDASRKSRSTWSVYTTTTEADLLSIQVATGGGYEIVTGSGDGGTPIATTVRGPAASGTDVAGGDLTYAASNGTGTGGSGDFIWQTAPAAGSGSSANTLTEVFRLSSAGKATTRASSTSSAGFNLPHGTAPSSPANGDLWSTTSGLFHRRNGTTDQLFPHSGGTLTGLVTTAASGTGSAGFNLPHGTAPTSPVNGDVWTTSTSIYARINGATIDLGGAGGSIGGSTGSTDNALLRADGTGGSTVQSSTVIVDDSGNVLGVGTLALSGAVTQTLSDGVTNTPSQGMALRHNSTDTPAAGFGYAINVFLESSTTENQSAGDWTWTWATATHGTRKARVIGTVYDTAQREWIRGEANGSAAMIGFLGANAVVRQSGSVSAGLVNLGLFSSVSLAAADLTGTIATARLGSGTANSSTFLRGDQTWATPGIGLGLIYLADSKAATTSGGTFTSGAWQTRTLAEVTDTDGNCTVASNQFTLTAGTYELIARVPAHRCDRHKARLENVTDATTLKVGSVCWAGVTGTDVSSDSWIFHRFAIAASKALEIQHQCETTRATDGFGEQAGFSAVEVYTEVWIRRIS